MMFKSTPTAAALRHWRLAAVLVSVFTVITKHYPLQKPAHVGMFAGSLLQRGDWDH